MKVDRGKLNNRKGGKLKILMGGGGNRRGGGVKGTQRET